MRNQLQNSQALPLPWITFKPFPKQSARRIMQNIKRLNTRFLASAAVVSVSLLLTVIGSAPAPSDGTASPARPSYPGLAALRKPVPKPPVKKAAPAVRPAGCAKDRENTVSALFAACPSLALDFSSQHDGLIDGRIFNIYTGAPEANREAQYYTADARNVQIKNGALTLTALNERRAGFNYTSARVDTKGKQDFLYGKFVIRATLPSNIGAWPAIWMLPTQQNYKSSETLDYYQRYLDNGEIDIAESVGVQPHTVYGIAHSLAYPRDGSNRNYYGTATIPGNDTAFHDYGLEWTPTSLTYSVDGNVFFTISKQPGADYHSWPYDQKFYLILNLALGGSWGGVDRAHFPKDGVDTGALPAQMKVSAVYYYPYVEKKR